MHKSIFSATDRYNQCNVEKLFYTLVRDITRMHKNYKTVYIYYLYIVMYLIFMIQIHSIAKEAVSVLKTAREIEKNYCLRFGNLSEHFFALEQTLCPGLSDAHFPAVSIAARSEFVFILNSPTPWSWREDLDNIGYIIR